MKTIEEVTARLSYLKEENKNTHETYKYNYEHDRRSRADDNLDYIAELESEIKVLEWVLGEGGKL